MSLFISIDEHKVKEHMLTYNKATGISCIYINEDGDTIFSEGERFQCCSKFQELTGNKSSCNVAHLNAVKVAEKIGEPYVFFCPSGLVHWAAPIVVKGIFKGGLIGGPVQMEMSDEYVVDEIIRKNNFHISYKGIFHAYIKNVPVVEPEKVRHLARMLYIVTKDLMKEEVQILENRKKFYEGQAAINEEIQCLKRKNDSEHIIKYYPVELEKELVSRVKTGNKKGARTILNELLGHVLFSSGSNFEIIKARVLELTIVLSRAAVEGGGNLECIFGLNLNYLQEISKVNSVEELCIWIVKVLERFMDSIFNLENINNNDAMQKARIFINDNLTRDISLEDVSEYVFLSPSYFSRLFKKEMGINYKDYLNMVRVEESKRYLSNPKLSMSEVAQSVGFADQSYFTKVFKKIEGVSPGQYRKIMCH